MGSRLATSLGDPPHSTASRFLLRCCFLWCSNIANPRSACITTKTSPLNQDATLTLANLFSRRRLFVSPPLWQTAPPMVYTRPVPGSGWRRWSVSVLHPSSCNRPGLPSPVYAIHDANSWLHGQLRIRAPAGSLIRSKLVSSYLYAHACFLPIQRPQAHHSPLLSTCQHCTPIGILLQSRRMRYTSSASAWC